VPMDKPSAYFLVGPTASGKSRLAHFIAKTQGLGVVSADSMNLYRGMDIGTAKPSATERTEVEYAGIDLVEPTEKFSVAAYLQAVRPALTTPPKKIIAGGTGLYVKCLTEGFSEVPPENPALRTELEQLDLPALQTRAQKEAPALYEKLTPDDQQNPRRLIRILEKRAPVSKSWGTQPRPKLLGLRVERETLHRRIEQRVDAMYASGLLEEARALHARELSPTALQAIGYAEAFAVLENRMSLEAAKERTVIRTRQLAKRQMTWFRNQLNVEWLDPESFSSIETLAEAALDRWQKIGSTLLPGIQHHD